MRKRIGREAFQLLLGKPDEETAGQGYSEVGRREYASLQDEHQNEERAQGDEERRVERGEKRGQKSEEKRQEVRMDREGRGERGEVRSGRVETGGEEEMNGPSSDAELKSTGNDRASRRREEGDRKEERETGGSQDGAHVKSWDEKTIPTREAKKSEERGSRDEVKFTRRQDPSSMKLFRPLYLRTKMLVAKLHACQQIHLARQFLQYLWSLACLCWLSKLVRSKMKLQQLQHQVNLQICSLASSRSRSSPIAERHPRGARGQLGGGGQGQERRRRKALDVGSRSFRLTSWRRKAEQVVTSRDARACPHSTRRRQAWSQEILLPQHEDEVEKSKSWRLQLKDMLSSSSAPPLAASQPRARSATEEGRAAEAKESRRAWSGREQS
eukprot:768617-Hanusia_phi.AAC.6